MKSILLFATLFYSSFLIGQSAILLPPDNVIKAFEKQYPKKKVTWDVEYSSKNEDVTFEAKFYDKPKTLAFAYFDKEGNFKVYKLQIPLTKLPQKAQSYLKTNYSVKSFKQSFSAVDFENIKSYETGVIKDSKFYKIVFDENGEFTKRVQIR